ncbi:MAG: FecR domain-containing protein [Byssovorax sp.]
MKPEPCSMALLVEATRDGRLGERELASIERHVATCASCAELARAVDHVRSLLRTPAPAPTPLEVQRGRLRLLREAALPVSPPGGPARARPLLAGALAIAAAAALLFFAHRRVPDSHASVAPPTGASESGPERTVTTVLPEGDARFDRASSDGTEIVTLVEGAIDLSVRHLDTGERFFVKTSDAEVEVRGTVFRAEAHDSHLRSVAVREGKVEVRFGGSTLLLGAGERWDRPIDALPVPAPVGSAPASAAPRVTATLAAPTAGRPPSLPPAKPAVDDGSAAFVEGMAMVERGDYGDAARHLEAFQKSNPRDERAEDAGFLVILALQRAGRPTEAAAAARRYLSAYPTGYRRAQARAIAEAP